MGIPVMILGESGSGKTTSLRNFTPDEIGVIGVVVAQPERREGEADETHGQPDDGDDGLELVALHAAHGDGDVMAKHFHFRS